MTHFEPGWMQRSSPLCSLLSTLQSCSSHYSHLNWADKTLCWLYWLATSAQLVFLRLFVPLRDQMELNIDCLHFLWRGGGSGVCVTLWVYFEHPSQLKKALILKTASIQPPTVLCRARTSVNLSNQAISMEMEPGQWSSLLKTEGEKNKLNKLPTWQHPRAEQPQQSQTNWVIFKERWHGCWGVAVLLFCCGEERKQQTEESDAK